MHRLFLLITLLLFTLLPAQAKDEPCSFDQSLCKSLSDLEQADKTLNTTYRRILKAIDEGRMADFRVDGNEIKSTLVTAQQKWITFRDSNCAALYTLMSGGTSRNQDRTECLTRMTRERVKFLRDTYEHGQ